jgi:hypothetical protein
MATMSPPRLAAVLLLAFAGPVAARADLDPLLPPDTESYVSVNVRQVIESPLFQKQLLAPLKQALEEVGGDQLKTILKDLGVDPFKDVDRLTMASPGGVEADRGLIIAQGTFDPAKFKAKAEEAARDHPEALKLHETPLGGGAKHAIWEVVIPNQDSSLFVALASNKLLLASPGKDYVVDALKRARDKKKAGLNNKAFQAILEKLDPKQSLSLAFLGKSIANADNEVVPKFLTDAFGNIEAVGGGLDVTNEIKLDILLASKDTESARRMQMALDKGLKLALVGLSLLGEERKELTLLLEVVKSVKVSARGKVVGVSGRLTRDVIEDFFKKDG